MRIIQANKYYYLRSGVARYLFELSKRLEQDGHEVIPFAMEYPDNLESPYAKYFVSEVQTGRVQFGWQAARTVCRMLYSMEARRKMATLIHKTRPDLCHVHNVYTQISPSILHTLADQKVPVVMTVHDHHLVSPSYNIWADGCGPDLRGKGIVTGTVSRFHKQSFAASFMQMLTFKFHRALKIYEKHVDLFICPSRHLSRQLLAAGFPKEKIRVLPNAIDPGIVEPRYDHDGYFVFVGRLSSEKGVETVIDLARRFPDETFKIAGTGPQKAYLHRYAQEAGNVVFTGFQTGDSLKELYRGAKAVLVPSRVHENAPLAILEAMAAGTPVIASDVGGVPEIVEDRSTGLLVQPLDLSGWVDAVMRLSLDESYRVLLARQARHRVETRFHIEQFDQRLLALYKEVLR